MNGQKRYDEVPAGATFTYGLDMWEKQADNWSHKVGSPSEKLRLSDGTKVSGVTIRVASDMVPFMDLKVGDKFVYGWSEYVKVPDEKLVRSSNCYTVAGFSLGWVGPCEMVKRTGTVNVPFKHLKVGDRFLWAGIDVWTKCEYGEGSTNAIDCTASKGHFLDGWVVTPLPPDEREFGTLSVGDVFVSTRSGKVYVNSGQETAREHRLVGKAGDHTVTIGTSRKVRFVCAGKTPPTSAQKRFGDLKVGDCFTCCTGTFRKLNDTQAKHLKPLEPGYRLLCDQTLPLSFSVTPCDDPEPKSPKEPKEPTTHFGDLEVGDTFICGDGRVFRKEGRDTARRLRGSHEEVHGLSATSKVVKTKLSDAIEGDKVVVFGKTGEVVGAAPNRGDRVLVKWDSYGQETVAKLHRAISCKIVTTEATVEPVPIPAPAPAPAPARETVYGRDLKDGDVVVNGFGEEFTVRGCYCVGPLTFAIYPTGLYTRIRKAAPPKLPQATGKERNGVVLQDETGRQWVVKYTYGQKRIVALFGGSSGEVYGPDQAQRFVVVSVPEQPSVKVGDTVQDPSSRFARYLYVRDVTVPHHHPLKLSETKTGPVFNANPEVTYSRV